MKATALEIPEVILFKPKFVADERGFFFESFNQRQIEAAAGRALSFVQDNHSRSTKGVLRGLHYETQQPHGKLVRVVQVYDVAVNIRRSSPTFGKWGAGVLGAENSSQLWGPESLAHGFVALSQTAKFRYKTNDYYASVHERFLLWEDKALGIEWPINDKPMLSPKDAQAPMLGVAEVFA